MLSIKTMNTINEGELHTILSLCKNDLDGFGWYHIKELTNNDIIFLSKNNYKPYTSENTIPQSILNLLINI
jgi:hypothetical protein